MLRSCLCVGGLVSFIWRPVKAVCSTARAIRRRWRFLLSQIANPEGMGTRTELKLQCGKGKEGSTTRMNLTGGRFWTTGSEWEGNCYGRLYVFLRT